MAHQTIQYQTALAGSSLVYAAHLLMTRDALAHEGHDHGPKKPETPTETESSPAASTTLEDSLESESSSPAPSGKNAIQEVPVQDAPPASVSKSGLFDGLSIGWGESLLGLIILGPFLLTSLRKKLQF